MPKNLLIYPILIFISLQFVFCRFEDSESGDDEVLKVTPTDMHFTAREGEKSFMVLTKYKMAWQIDSTFSEGWVHIKEGEGNKMLVLVDANLSGLERTSIIEVATVDKKHKKVISITQITDEALVLEVSADTINLYTNPEKQHLTVTADGEWHMDSIPEWISIQKIDSVGQKTVFEIVQSSANSGRDLRSHLISILHGQDKTEVLIRQWGTIDAHIYNNSGQLISILAQDNLSESIETLTLTGAVSLSDLEVIKTIKNLRKADLSGIQLSDGSSDLPPFALKENLSLEEINIPVSVKVISRGLFMGSPQLREVNVAEGVAVIEEIAFSGCHNLSVLKLPKSLSKIETGAFKDSFLKELVLAGEAPPTMGDDVFNESLFETCVISIPKGSLDVYRASKGWDRFINYMERTE